MYNKVGRCRKVEADEDLECYLIEAEYMAKVFDLIFTLVVLHNSQQRKK